MRSPFLPFLASVLVQPPPPQARVFLLRGLGHQVTQHRWFLESPQGAMLESGNPCNRQGSTLCRIKSPTRTENVLWSSKGLRTELAPGTKGNTVHPFLQASPLRPFGENFTVELERVVGNFSVRVDQRLLVRTGVRSPREDKRPRNLMTPFLSCCLIIHGIIVVLAICTLQPASTCCNQDARLLVMTSSLTSCGKSSKSRSVFVTHLCRHV